MTQSGWGFALVGFGIVLGASCGGESHGETEEPDRSHPELCGDGYTNGNETDIDCGGTDCFPCPVLASCKRHDDCASTVCRASTCQAPTCSDETPNGEESDVDCGGSCAACPGGERCSSNDDCASLVCDDGRCAAASCVDGVLNGRETDVDCGGGECQPCTSGRCLSADDCESGLCDVDGRCASCDDHAQNGAETDVDCGGPDCRACAVGELCDGERDCESGVCGSRDGSDSICHEAHCGNGVLDGDEGDRDCGGSCPSSCEQGQGCRVDSDCAFWPNCKEGICIEPCTTVDDCATGADCTDEQCTYCQSDDNCRAGYYCSRGYCLVNP